MLDGMESQSYAAHLMTLVESLSVNNLAPDEDTASYRSDLLMKLASLLRSQSKRNRLSHFPSLSSDHRFTWSISSKQKLTIVFHLVLFICLPLTLSYI